MIDSRASPHKTPTHTRQPTSWGRSFLKTQYNSNIHSTADTAAATVKPHRFRGEQLHVSLAISPLLHFDVHTSPVQHHYTTSFHRFSVYAGSLGWTSSSFLTSAGGFRPNASARFHRSSREMPVKGRNHERRSHECRRLDRAQTIHQLRRSTHRGTVRMCSSCQRRGARPRAGGRPAAVAPVALFMGERAK